MQSFWYIKTFKAYSSSLGWQVVVPGFRFSFLGLVSMLPNLQRKQSPYNKIELPKGNYDDSTVLKTNKESGYNKIATWQETLQLQILNIEGTKSKLILLDAEPNCIHILEFQVWKCDYHQMSCFNFLGFISRYWFGDNR